MISVPSWYRNWPTPLIGLDKWLSFAQQSSAGEAFSCLGSFAFSRRANGNLRTELLPGELSAGVCGKASIHVLFDSPAELVDTYRLSSPDFSCGDWPYDDQPEC